MTIDIAALRKFQDTWGPVMQAIPAVMELEAKQADMNRWVTAKQLELEKATAEIATAYEEADKRLAAYNAQVTEALEAVAKAKADADELKRTAQDRVKTATAKATAKLETLEAQVAAREAKLKGLDAEVAETLKAAKAEREAVLAALDADIKALEERKAAAETALEALRAKLG